MNKQLNKARGIKRQKDLINLYNRNADIINRTHEVSYETWKRRVRAKMRNDPRYEGLDIYQAAKKYMNTEQYVTAGERSRTNLLNAMKGYASKRFEGKNMYQELQYLSKQEGKYGRSVFSKINLTWNKALRRYEFSALGVLYYIDVTNSPEDIFIMVA